MDNLLLQLVFQPLFLLELLFSLLPIQLEALKDKNTKLSKIGKIITRVQQKLHVLHPGL